MNTFLKFLSLAVMAIVPGGLLVLSAFVLAKLVNEKMEVDVGPKNLKLARALKSVKWSDVMKQAKQTL